MTRIQKISNQDTVSIGDTIRQLNAAGIKCHNFERNEAYPVNLSIDDFEHAAELKWLDLEGLEELEE